MAPRVSFVLVEQEPLRLAPRASFQLPPRASFGLVELAPFLGPRGRRSGRARCISYNTRLRSSAETTSPTITTARMAIRMVDAVCQSKRSIAP